MKMRENFVSLGDKSTPMSSVPLKLIQYASNIPIDAIPLIKIDTRLNFYDYFKIKPEYEGWEAGLEYGI